MTVEDLPPVSELTEQQQRGWRCVWCGHPLAAGLDVDLGEQRARAVGGASYLWFARACADTAICAARIAPARR